MACASARKATGSILENFGARSVVESPPAIMKKNTGENKGSCGANEPRENNTR